MNLAVVAAFTAAGISLINVIITARLAFRSQREQWQREEVRPIVARILVLAREAGVAWSLAARAQDEWHSLPATDPAVTESRKEEREHYEAGYAALRKLRTDVAELRLIAAPRSREAAESLLLGHEKIWLDAWPHEPRPGAGKRLEQAHLGRLQRDLVERARADLGVPRGTMRYRFGRAVRKLRWRARRLRRQQAPR